MAKGDKRKGRALTKSQRALCGKRITVQVAMVVFYIWLKHKEDVKATAEESGYSVATISKLVNHGHRSLGIAPFKEMAKDAPWMAELAKSPLQKAIEAAWKVNETTGTRTMLATVELTKRCAAATVANAMAQGLDGKDQVSTCESALRMLRMAAELEAIYMPKAKAAGITEVDGDLPETAQMSVDQLKSILLDKEHAPVNVNVGVQLTTSTVNTPDGNVQIPDPTIIPAKALKAPRRKKKAKVKNPSGELPYAGESEDEHNAIRKKLWELGPPDEV